jgi:hypothetical protein
LNQRSPPCQGVLLADIGKETIKQTYNRSNIDVGRDFKSSPPISIDWKQFHQFLLQRMTAKTAEDRMQYAKRYVDILANNNSGNACSELLSATPNKRIHIMKALSSVARFTGRSEQWRQMRQQYQLNWATGTEKIDAFTRFFDDSRSLDVMLQWLHEALRALPSQYANLLLFCTLTGMRGSECIESLRLINQRHHQYDIKPKLGSQIMDRHKYYNPERQILQHYLYPQIFIRRTKAIYISIVNEQIIEIARRVEGNPSLIGLKKAIMRRRLSMSIKYCRKIHASWLHHRGVSSDLIDALQGRISKSIFLRHYLSPSADYKDKVLENLSELQKQLGTE